MPRYQQSYRRQTLHTAGYSNKKGQGWLVLSTCGVAMALLGVWLRGLYMHVSESAHIVEQPIIERKAAEEQVRMRQKVEANTCPAGSRVPAADDKFLDAMFTRLSTDTNFAHFSPRVLKPESPNDESPPWVLVLDHFLPTHEETMNHLTSKEIQEQFALSALGGGGTNDKYRRSESYNCAGACLQQAWVAPIVQGMEHATGLTMAYAEDITFTHYRKGGFYGRHHDYSLKESNPKLWENCGPRILTFLVYLNDVDLGGATSFFHLGLDVEPKKGRALIFPDVFPERPFEKDERTAHEALIVNAGEKYIAQTWFHQYDYQVNMDKKCCY